MEKKLIGLVLVAFLFAGCSGLQITNEQAMDTAIRLSAYNLGYYVGDRHPEYDAIIANAYTVARTGTMTPAQMAEALATLKLQNPQLTGSLMIVLSSMGATVDAGGGVVGLSGIPVAYWDAAADGYAMGYEMAQANKRAVNQSAIVQYIMTR
jgi:hypothetical protein